MFAVVISYDCTFEMMYEIRLQIVYKDDRLVSVLTVCSQKMLEYLKDKKDVGFFLSVQALMQTCRSVFTLGMLCLYYLFFFFFLICRSIICI